MNPNDSMQPMQTPIVPQPTMTTLVQPPAPKSNKLVVSLISLLAVLVLAGAGFGIYTLGQNSKNSKTAATATPTASAGKYSGWKTYTSTQETGVSFRYPSNWTLATVNEAMSGGDSITVTSPSGSSITWDSNVAAVGGACGESSPTWKYIFSAPTQTSDYSVVGLQLSDNSAVTYGVIPTTDVKSVGTDTGSCSFYAIFKSVSDSNRQMWLWNGNSNIVSGDTDTVKLILESFTYSK